MVYTDFSAGIQAKGYMHFANGWMFVIPLYYAAITSLSLFYWCIMMYSRVAKEGNPIHITML